MNHNQDKLEYLLANKSYQDLLPEEKAWISHQYSEEEYNAMCTALSGSVSFFKKNQTRPNPEIKSKLRQRLKQNKQPATVKPLLNYRIPAWQAVAAFALLLFFVPQVQKNQVNGDDSERIFIFKTDTVYKESPVERTIDQLVDTLTDIPKVRKILSRTNKAPIKASTVVFSKDETLSANLSRDLSALHSSEFDTVSVENMISRYLKDSVKSYQIDIDTGFQDIGRVY